jgi:Lrp/AsnC family transcriptional regulator for asnA, asnC and gidA
MKITIIRHLKDGKKSLKKIAENLGIAENTVRSRVDRMKEEGILEISGLVDPSCLPGHTLVFVGVKVGSMNLVKKGEEFSKLKGVVSVSVVTGRYDLILQVFLNRDFGLLEFYTNEVSRISEVQSVETFVIYKAYNVRIPYVL